MSRTFETSKPLLYQSDITNTNKINSILCDYSQCKITTPINPIIKKKLSSSTCDSYLFNKTIIIVTLYSSENLENINVIQKTSTGATPTTVDISSNNPFFYDYAIDNDNKLLGNKCNSVNYTNYFTQIKNP